MAARGRLLLRPVQRERSLATLLSLARACRESKNIRAYVIYSADEKKSASRTHRANYHVQGFRDGR